MTDLSPTTTGRLLLSADRPPIGEVAAVNEHQPPEDHGCG